MNPVKLSGITAIASKTADHGAILAPDHSDLVVLAIGAQQKGLFRIGPDRDVPHRAVAERALLVEPFRHEGAVLFEHLDAVVGAITDVDQPVIGELHAM